MSDKEIENEEHSDTSNGKDPEATAAVDDEPSAEQTAEIEEERQRRLDPENRPDNAEVDNSDKTLPTVEEFDQMNAEDEVEGSAGSSDPGKAFRDIELSEEEIAALDKEREERLDPDNRPDNAEVDNTGKSMEDGDLVGDEHEQAED